MIGILRLASLTLALCLYAAVAPDADAQLLQRARKKLQDKIEQKAEERVDRALDRAADEAAEEVVGAAEQAVTGARPAAAPSGTAYPGADAAAAGAAATNAAAMNAAAMNAAAMNAAATNAAAANAAAANAAAMQAAAGSAAVFQVMGTGGAASTEPVDFRALKALLPESLPGLSRSEATGQKTNTMGIKSSVAEADYRSAGSASVHLTITDLGTMSGLAMYGYGWAGTEIDSETERGYERTITYRGYPAREKYEHGSGYRTAEFSVVVAQRFIVQIDGNDVDVEVLRAGADQIDFAQLEALKAEAEASAQTTLADFRALKALLPEQAAGLARTHHAGQQTVAFGVQSATAEARYENDSLRVHATITDMGSQAGIGAMGYAWTTTQIDSESDHGFERTVKYGEHPGYQKYSENGSYRHAELQLIVGQRFVVALRGENTAMADLEAVLAAIDLTRLAAP